MQLEAKLVKRWNELRQVALNRCWWKKETQRAKERQCPLVEPAFDFYQVFGPSWLTNLPPHSRPTTS